MLDSIVTSKSRLRLLMKFFLNPDVKAYLRELSSEFNDSTNAVRVELNRLVQAKLLKIEKNGRHKYYSANTEHPLFPEIHSISKKVTGLDQIYQWVSAIGSLEAAYVSGDYARGIDSGVIDLVLIGDLDTSRVYDVMAKTERLICRRIRPFFLTRDEFTKMGERFRKEKMLVLWSMEFQNA